MGRKEKKQNASWGYSTQYVTSSPIYNISLTEAGIAQWLERRNRDRKVPGSSLRRSGRKKKKFSRVDFLCWLLFRYPFHPRVTAVASKRSRSFCQKCRWQVTAKYTCTLPMWLWLKWHCKLVHGCMVYTELAPRRQQIHVVPAMQRPNNFVSTPLRWIFCCC